MKRETIVEVFTCPFCSIGGMLTKEEGKTHLKKHRRTGTKKELVDEELKKRGLKK